MITIVFKVTIKKGKEEEFGKLVVPQLIQSAKENNCLEYSIDQNVENNCEFVLQEKWKDKLTWDDHLNNLIKLFGEKPKDSILPVQLENYFEKTESILYKED